MRGNYGEKEGKLRNMIIPTKGRKFRRKYASDKEPTNIRTYKSFFSKKVSKSHFVNALCINIITLNFQGRMIL